MLGKYAAAYIIWSDTIASALNSLRTAPPFVESGMDKVALALMGRDPPADPDLAKHVQDSLNAVLNNITSRMPLQSVAAQSKRIDALVARKASAKELIQAVEELKNRLFDELCERQFFYVQPERAKYYTDPMLFGKDVNDRYPIAIDDIEDAGKSLALGQGTACVLHTMRVVEVGLRSLGKALNIPYAPSWESYLKQISTNIAAKHNNKTTKWKSDEKFYRDLSGDLLTIKQAWRNPTMHVDRKYSVDEAEQIFLAARAFMTRLASHFSAKAMEKLLK